MGAKLEPGTVPEATHATARGCFSSLTAGMDSPCQWLAKVEWCVRCRAQWPDHRTLRTSHAAVLGASRGCVWWRRFIEMLISGVFDKTIRRVGIDLEEERCYTEPGVWFDRALQIDERSDIAHSSSTFISSSKICARPFSLSPERQDDLSSGPTQLVDSPM